MKMDQSIFIENKQLWCDSCGRTQVDSNDSDTGKCFFKVGPEWNSITKTLGAYTTVVYAICSDCFAEGL